MILKKIMVLLLSIAFIINAQTTEKKNSAFASLFFTTKGFESENSDFLHGYISYERNLIQSLYVTVGFSFYRTPKGTLKFKQDGKQWDVPLQAGFLLGKGVHRFNGAIGVDFSYYTLNDAPLRMVGLSKKGFEVHPTLSTSWRIYPEQVPLYADIGTKVVVDYHGGIPVSIGVGGGVGCIF